MYSKIVYNLIILLKNKLSIVELRVSINQKLISKYKKVKRALIKEELAESMWLSKGVGIEGIN